MRKIFLLAGMSLLFLGCSAAVAPNGMSWDEYHAAKYNLKVTYAPDAVSGCQELGEVKGMDYNDMGSAKEVAEEATVSLGGNYLFFNNLWHENRWGELLPNRQEIYHADGLAYRCIN